MSNERRELAEQYARVLSYAKTIEMNAQAQMGFIARMTDEQVQLMRTAIFAAVTAIDNTPFVLGDAHRLLHEEFPDVVPENPPAINVKLQDNNDIVTARSVPGPSSNGPRIVRP